ncbi:MAG: MBL fold metallo-hydrolase [Fimbriimonadaceae bacterium]
MKCVWFLPLIFVAGCAGSPEGELSFLAVGQGDCTVFRAGGKTILIDVGPKTPTFDAGQRIILPWLRQQGIGTIDLILLTHPDSDHVGGLAAICAKKRVGKIVIPAHFRSHEGMNETLRGAGVKPENVLWLDRPMEANVGEFKLKMMSPPWNPEVSDNDGSLFAWIGKDSATAVISGDAGIETEMQMAPKADWSAAIIHAGHHGSKSSTGDAWLNEVKPKICVFSCGRDNSYGHPAPEVMDQINRKGIRAYRTDRDGTLTFRYENGVFVLER